MPDKHEKNHGEAMPVTIRLHPFIAEGEVPTDSLIAEGATVGACIENLLRRFPFLEDKLFSKPGRLHAYLEIYVNEESVYPHELSMPVNEGDEITVTYFLSGG